MGKRFSVDETTAMLAMSEKVRTNAGEIAGTMRTLIGQVDGVAWTGDASDAFKGAMGDWTTQVDSIGQQLEAIADTIRTTATNYDVVIESSTTGYEHVRGQNLPI